VSDVEDQHGAGRVIDSNRPSVARVFNALLGGKDNYRIDRDIRDGLLAKAPEFGRLSWDVREFLMRVTRFLAGEVGVHQFLDCGPGLPSTENTHEVAQRANREATVVYAAADPVVLAHGRALLAENDRTHLAEVDFRYPDQVMANETVRKYLDFEQPIAVYHVGTMQYLGDDWRPAELMASYIDALPSGSYVAMAHLSDPGDEQELIAGLRGAFEGSPISLGHFRTHEQLLGHLDGLELIDPGLVVLADWWPDGPRIKPHSPAQRLALGALGRKP
jgi:SAM-dependent methyltransferase